MDWWILEILMPEVRTQSSISTGLQIVLLQQIAVDPFFASDFGSSPHFRKESFKHHAGTRLFYVLLMQHMKKCVNTYN